MEETGKEPRPDASEELDIPGFRTWRGVYLFVLACFVLCVALLALFTRVFA